MRPAFGDLHVCYLIDRGDRYDYVQNRDSKAARISPDQLHEIGLANLRRLAAKRNWKLQAHGGVFDFLMGGEFEATVLLLDDFWEHEFRRYVQGDYAAVVPSRDVLAFCEVESESGIRELQSVVDRVSPSVRPLQLHFFISSSTAVVIPTMPVRMVGSGTGANLLECRLGNSFPPFLNWAIFSGATAPI